MKTTKRGSRGGPSPSERSTVLGSGYCLFSAPYEFIQPEIRDGYRVSLPTVFREIWRKDDIEADAGVRAWLPNPGQSFVIDGDILDLLPSLAVIVSPSTGTNHVDREACERRGVAVLSLLDDRQGLEEIAASAEFTFLLLLNALRRLDLAVQEVSARRWREREDSLRGYELRGKQVGIVGLGRIGRRMVRYCRAFDAEPVFFDPYVSSDGIAKLSLEELFSTSDAVCICCTLTDETKGMIDVSLLRRMKQGACLVNTSRGEVIREEDLVTALQERVDLLVCTDVLCGEVHSSQLDSPLVNLHEEGRIIITPHIAGATVESQTKAALIALELLRTHVKKGAMV